MLPEHVHDSRLWFPGLAEYLVSRIQGRRILIDQYGTQKWLTGDANASVVGIGTVRIGRHLSKIEQLPTSTTASFSDLTFADDQGSRAEAQIQDAAEVLDRVKTLADAIGRLVRSIHVLKAPKDHDVSHSSPHLPFSVFVSVPEPAERDATLRIAESLIHEAMHLQLSLLDNVEPLVGAPGSTGYSPWKQQIRPVDGLLHGIYVFAVIHQALGILAESEPASRPYSIKRSHAIQEEVDVLPEQVTGLSAAGNALWQRCRHSVLGQ